MCMPVTFVARLPFNAVFSATLHTEPVSYGSKAAPCVRHRRAEWCSIVQCGTGPVLMAVPKRHIRGVPIEPYVAPERRPGVFPVGRSCPHCGTHLSVYNPGPECFQHSPRRYFHQGSAVVSEAAEDFYELLMSEVA